MGKPLLKRIAEKVLGSEYAELIWKRVEILGDIAVIRKSYSIDIPIDVFKALGEELLKELPYVKSVWLAVTPV
ncbi:MAG: class I SAM-dependent methyltransferase family protein, partial [Desulfurococcaceae archaeon]|nr:class I SAM-dependent methyltransferase family protein [Desulfurococcaceae archaeon]